MEKEPIAWQIILMIISALGLLLWGLVQLTLTTINKRLTQIEILVHEFGTFKAVHDKTHEHIDTTINDIKHRVDEHDDLIEEHDKKIDNLTQQIKQSKSQILKKTTTRGTK